MSLIKSSLATFAIARICGHLGFMDQINLDRYMGQTQYRSGLGADGVYRVHDVDAIVDAIRHEFDPNYFANCEVILFCFKFSAQELIYSTFFICIFIISLREPQTHGTPMATNSTKMYHRNHSLCQFRWLETVV